MQPIEHSGPAARALLVGPDSDISQIVVLALGLHVAHGR